MKAATCPAVDLLCCIAAVLLGGQVAAQQVCETRDFPLSSPTARFDDNADGTVTDTTTRLMWMRCSDGQTWSNGQCSGTAARHAWQSAQRLAEQVNRTGVFFFNDWRLPQLRELATITERQCKNPRTNLAVFPQTPAASYWTASSRLNQQAGDFAFALDFQAEGLRYADKQGAMHVRLVRNAR